MHHVVFLHWHTGCTEQGTHRQLCTAQQVWQPSHCRQRWRRVCRVPQHMWVSSCTTSGIHKHNPTNYRYILASDQRLAQLRKHAHSPVTWFRHPYVVLITVSTDDVDTYRKTLKPRIKSMIDTYAAHPGSYTDYVVLYVRPVTTDQAAKGPRRVFDALRHDFGRQRDRCVRMDVHARRGSGTGAAPGVLGGGVEELERQIREAVRVTFEARGQAYEDEVLGGRRMWLLLWLSIRCICSLCIYTHIYLTHLHTHSAHTALYTCCIRIHTYLQACTVCIHVHNLQ